MKLFERYLAKEILGATLVVTLAFLGLFAFFDLISELRDIGRGGYQLRHALAYVSLIQPGRAYEILPICVLIGTLYALTVLARHSEITVLRTSGLSTRTLLASLMRIGMVFVVLTVLLGEFVAPPAERLGQQMRLQSTGKMVAREFRSGLWVKDGLAFVNVRDVLPNANLERVRIFDFDTEFRLVKVREAARGEYVGQDTWRLSDVVQTEFVASGSRIERAASAEWHSGLTPELVSVLLVDPDRMSITTLYRYVSYLGENRRNTEKYEIALWKKMIFPFASLVMMVLALPFAYLQDRFGAVSVKVFTGIMLGIGFHMLNGLFSNLGAINGWPPHFAAITPSAIFLLAGGLLLWQVERR
jgi:lipopolysaccharide export system permease protein